MKTTKQILDEMEKSLFGYNDRGIVTYSDGLAVSGYKTPYAICNNCGFSAKGEEAKEMMFGHKDCPKPNGKYIRNDVTVEKIHSYTRKLIESVAEEIIGEDAETFTYYGISQVDADFSSVGGMRIEKGKRIKFKSVLTDEEMVENRFRAEQRLKVKEIINSLDK